MIPTLLTDQTLNPPTDSTLRIFFDISDQHPQNLNRVVWAFMESNRERPTLGAM